MDKGGQQNSYEVFLPKRFTKRVYKVNDEDLERNTSI